MSSHRHDVDHDEYEDRRYFSEPDESSHGEGDNWDPYCESGQPSLADLKYRYSYIKIHFALIKAALKAQSCTMPVSLQTCGMATLPSTDVCMLVH